MTFPTKFVTLSINISIILLTIMFPSESTAFAMIPIIISGATWAFMDYSTLDGKKKHYATSIVVIATIVGCLCFVINLCCEITKDPNTANWFYVVRSGIAYLEGMRIPYICFEIPIMIVAVLLLTITSFLEDKEKSPTKKVKCFEDYI